MKYLFPIFLFLCSCGAQDSAVDLSMTSIVWKGYPHQYKNNMFVVTANDTVTCLKNLNLHLVRNEDPLPYLIITEGKFLCGGTSIYACHSQGIIYLALVHLERKYAYSHEIIHWSTELSNDAHFTLPFNECENFDYF